MQRIIAAAAGLCLLGACRIAPALAQDHQHPSHDTAARRIGGVSFARRRRSAKGCTRTAWSASDRAPEADDWLSFWSRRIAGEGLAAFPSTASGGFAIPNNGARYTHWMAPEAGCERPAAIAARTPRRR
jgi:hypothetical protein